MRACATSELYGAFMHVLKHLAGTVVDFGCGQVRVIPTAIGVDFETHYNMPSTHKYAYRTDATITCGWERFVDFCEQVGARFDVVFSSHLLEDYDDAYGVLERWLGIVRVGGKIVLVLPVEDEYRRKTRDELNEAHKQNWRGSADFVNRMPPELAQRVDVVEALDGIGEWSFVVVLMRRE